MPHHVARLIVTPLLVAIGFGGCISIPDEGKFSARSGSEAGAQDSSTEAEAGDGGPDSREPDSREPDSREPDSREPDADASPPDSLRCGDRSCEPVGPHQACCSGPVGDRCGVKINGGQCVEFGMPATLTSQCPSYTVLGFADGLGCCREAGTCGVEFSLLGSDFGCAEPSTLGLPSGKICTPGVASCSGFSGDCAADADCCPFANGEQVCVQFADESTKCTKFCTTPLGCDSGCCVPLTSGKGACADPSQCFTVGCGLWDDTCGSDADCCETYYCIAVTPGEPGRCRSRCAETGECFTFGAETTPCITRPGKEPYCDTAHNVLCTDTCFAAKNGVCDDVGGPCVYGTDCADCGQHAGGSSVCVDGVGCETSFDGVCDEGFGDRPASCGFGGDCNDCGARLSVCANICPTAKDGTCDEMGRAAGPGGTCAVGTDCADCGAYFGGRGQYACDGTHGAGCLPGGAGGALDHDGVCQCPDCPWEAADCGPSPSTCDGKSLGYCCASENPCAWEADGQCDCGSWCPWETQDCGGPASP